MKNLHGNDWVCWIAWRLDRAIREHHNERPPQLKSKGRPNTLDAANDHLLRDIGLGDSQANCRDCRWS